MRRARKNPIDKPTDLELVAGGVASIALIGLGVTLAVQSQKTQTDLTTTIQDVAGLTAIATFA